MSVVDTFYKIPEVNEFNLLYNAKEKTNCIQLTELNLEKSFTEVKSKKTFDEIVEIYKKTPWFYRSLFFIRRNLTKLDPKYKDFLEVRLKCKTENEIEYCISIQLDLKFEKYFIDKYNLELKKF